MAPYRVFFKIRSNIYNDVFFAEILNFIKLLTIFAKRLNSRCLSRLKIGFWLRVWNTVLTLVPSLQIRLRKYSAGKFVWHIFWKSERCLCRSSRPKVSLKKVLRKISQNSQKKSFLESLFLGKVKLCKSEVSLKSRLYRRCFLVNLAKFIRTPFLQNTARWLLLIIAVSVNCQP